MEISGIIFFFIGFFVGGAIIWILRQNELDSMKKGEQQLKQTFSDISNEVLLANYHQFWVKLMKI